MLVELLKSALVLVFSFGLKWLLGQIGVQLDEAVFNSIVAALVAWILAQFGLEGAHAILAKRGYNLLGKNK